MPSIRLALSITFLPLLFVCEIACASGDAPGIPTNTPRPTAEAGPPPAEKFTLTILHHNDPDSRLIGVDEEAGVARFASVVHRLRAEGESESDGVVMLSAGDSFLSGPEFDASLAKGSLPYYDALAMDIIGYDAIALGNHEFDFGPEITANFIASFAPGTPFLSANLDVSAEPRLAELARDGRLTGRVILNVKGEPVGVIGVTTPSLPYISSPRRVVVNPDVAGVVQAEVEALTAAGVNKILLLNHSQSIRGATELAAQLNGVDVIVTGLGDEALANDGDLLIPGHESQVIGPYPVLAQDAGGRDVPVVTGVGGYNYVGRLVASFDATGNITSIGDTSGPVRVMGGSHADASAPHKEVQALVDEPVKRFLGDQGHTVVARLDVPLEAHRPNIRIQETNGGNLVADAVRWQAAQAAAGFGAPQPTVAVQNAGGIRTPKLIPAGSLTRLDVNTMLPFPNFVSIVAGLSAADLKAVVENAVSRVEFADGRFPHISGFSMVYDPEGSPRVVDENGKLTSKGARVVSITLDDGTPIVEDGQVVPGAPAINVASVDFLARGGDLYPYAGFEFTRLGVRYNDALANYIRDGLNGMITAAQYPEGGSGRARTLAEAAKP